METGFNQAPLAIGEPELEARQNLLARIGNTVRNGYEHARDNIKTYAAIGAASLSLAGAELAATTEPVTAENLSASLSSGTVLHRHSSLKTQTVLNRIHTVIEPYSVDNDEQNNNCHLGGYNPFPHVPCHTEYVIPTQAFLTPDAGGFKTDCSNPELVTYHFYKISPRGQAFHTCGPGPNPGVFHQQYTKPGEFQPKLNSIGNNLIQKSAGLNYQETVKRVGGTRKKLKASYQCPAPIVDPTSPDTVINDTAVSGVEKIVLHRNRSVTITTC